MKHERNPPHTSILDSIVSSASPDGNPAGYLKKLSELDWNGCVDTELARNKDGLAAHAWFYRELDRKLAGGVKLKSDVVVAALKHILERARSGGAPHWFIGVRDQLVADKGRDNSSLLLREPLLRVDGWAPALRTLLGTGAGGGGLVTGEGAPAAGDQVAAAREAIKYRAFLESAACPVPANQPHALAELTGAVLREAPTEVDAQAALVDAHRFVSRLRQLWASDTGQANRLGVLAQALQAELYRQWNGCPAAKQGLLKPALQRVALCSSVGLIARAAMGSDWPKPGDNEFPWDPDGKGERLAQLLDFLCDEGAHKLLNAPDVLAEIGWVLRSAALGLEYGVGLKGYPRFADDAEDTRPEKRRVRFLAGLAIAKGGAQMFPALSPSMGSGPEPRLKAQFVRGDQSVNTGEIPDGEFPALARKLVEIEIDGWTREHEASAPPMRLEALKARTESDAQQSVFPDELCVEALARAVPNTPRHVFFSELLAARTERQPDHVRSVMEDGPDKTVAYVQQAYCCEFEARTLWDLVERHSDEFPDSAEAIRRQILSDSAPEDNYFGQMEAKGVVESILAAPSRLWAGHVPPLTALAVSAVESPVAAAALEELLDTSGPIARQLWQDRTIDGYGRKLGTALGMACNPHVLDGLAAAGSSSPIDFSPNQRGLTALMAAARSVSDGSESRLAALKKHWKLLAGPGGVDAHDKRGFRAIHHAFRAGNAAVVGVLLEAGATPGFRTEDRTTILIEALQAPETGGGSRLDLLQLAGLACTRLDQEARDRLVGFVGEPALYPDHKAVHALPLAMDGQIVEGLQAAEILAAVSPKVWASSHCEHLPRVCIRANSLELDACYRRHVGFADLVRARVSEVTCAFIAAMTPATVSQVLEKLNRLAPGGGVAIAAGGKSPLVAFVDRLAAAGVDAYQPQDVASVCSALLSQGWAATGGEGIVVGGEHETVIMKAWRRGFIGVALMIADTQFGANDASVRTRAGHVLSQIDGFQQRLPLGRRIFVDHDGDVRWPVAGNQAIQLGLGGPVGDELIRDPRGEAECVRWLSRCQVAINRNLLPEIFGGATVQTVSVAAFERLLAHLHGAGRAS